MAQTQSPRLHERRLEHRPRRHTVSPFVWVSLFAFILPAWPQQIIISDPGLEAAIRSALNQPSGDLTAQQLESLVNLNASYHDVANLAGLGAAHNLRYLDLRYNRLEPLSFPVGLSNLSGLYLSGNQLTEISLPPDLQGLSVLYLNENQIS